MSGITDFHSHILPGIDDGSQNVDQSLQMLRLAAKQGVSRMVATPHFYAHNNTPQQFLEDRRKALAQLQEAMAEETGLPELVMAAEVYYFPGMSDADALQSLTVGERPFLLVEMPFATWTEDMYQELEQIELKQGLIPIIAHLDRYLTAWNRRSILKQLSKLQVLIQVNTGFFRNKKTQKTALKMLKKGQIHLLGTDCHDETRRPPNLQEMLDVIEQTDCSLLDEICYWEQEVFGR